MEYLSYIVLSNSTIITIDGRILVTRFKLVMNGGHIDRAAQRIKRRLLCNIILM